MSGAGVAWRTIQYSKAVVVTRGVAAYWLPRQAGAWQ